MKLTNDKSLIGGIVILIAAMILIVYVNKQQSKHVHANTNNVELTQQLLLHTEELLVLIVDYETGTRGYALTGDTLFLQPFNHAEKNIPTHLDYLFKLKSKDYLQKQRLQELSNYVAARKTVSENLITAKKKNDITALPALLNAGKAATDSIRSVIARMQNEEQANLKKLQEINHKDIKRLDYILYALLGTIFVLSLLLILKLYNDYRFRKKAEERLLALLDAAPDATVMVDEAGTIQSVNKQCVDLFGYSRNELLGQRVEILIPQHARQNHTGHRAHFNKTPQKRGMGSGLELYAVKKDGSTFPVEISLSPIQTDEGILVAASVRDITYRKIIEQKLKLFNEDLSKQVHEKTAEIREVFERVSDAFIALNQQDELLIINVKAEELLERKAETLVGKNLFTELPRLRNSTFDNAYRKAIKTQENTTVEIYDADRNTWFSVKLYPSSKGVAFYIADISEAKRAEQQLQATAEKYKLLFHANPTPLFIVDMRNYRFIEVNEAVEKCYGYTKEEFLHMSLKDIRPPEEIPTMLAYLQQPANNIKHAGVWTHMKKDGTLIHVEVVVKDIEYNNAPARIISCLDVTEKLKAENELKASYDQLRQLSSHLSTLREEERKHIAREIHDELGQIITGLKMDISWINRNLDKPQEKLIEKLAESTVLIDEAAKTVRRIASELRPSFIDDIGLTAALEHLCQDFQEKTGIRCSCSDELDDVDLPANVKINLYRIGQESLTNIMRHAQATQVTFSLKYEPNQITLTITDNGKGFDTSNPTKTLGLVGMRERAIMLGGTNHITSQPGQGTTIFVQVPL